MTARAVTRDAAGSHGNIRQRRLFGVLLIFAGTVLWSTAGLFVRSLDMDTWTMVAWRSLLASISMAVVVLALRGAGIFRFRRSIGPGGAAAIPIMVISMFSYVAALNLTSVANVMVTYATVPFMATGLAFLLLRERPTAQALVASAVAFTGVAFMAMFETAASDLAGNALALLMTAAFAASVVIARRWPDYDAMLVTCISSALCGLACFVVILADTGSPRIPTPGQMGLLVLFSIATQSLSYLLFLIGSRHVPSSEVGLIALLDVVLGPFWVWLVFAEEPGLPALVGGALVLSAVLGFLILQAKQARATG